MKTFIEVNQDGLYSEKMAKLEACLNDGTVLGSVAFDLAWFAKPDKYEKKMNLRNTIEGISEQSFIKV
jgi:hypothetical protein